NHCKVLILAISPNSTKSKNVVRELALASEEEKTILPVFLEPTDIPESMKYQLAGIQRVDYFAGNEEEAIGSVLRALSRLGITTNDSEPSQALGQALDRDPTDITGTTAAGGSFADARCRCLECARAALPGTQVWRLPDQRVDGFGQAQPTQPA
ncbi:MAG: toll/interleukin-1 receptor domain-containing protein, partial [Limisphaerales bacterium]